MVQNAANPEEIKKRSKQDKLNDTQEKLDLEWILSTPQGRRFIWKFLTTAGIFQSSFTGNSTTFFNEGKRDIGLKLLAEVTEANPDAYTLMMKESKGDNSNGGQSQT